MRIRRAGLFDRQAGNQSPVVNAGSDQSVSTGATVNLSASATDADGTITGYAWTQVSGTAVTLSNAAIANPSFTAPGSATTIVLRCTATDNLGATGFDDVQITVSSGSLPANNPGPSGSASITITGPALTQDYLGGSLTGQRLKIEYGASGGADGTFPYWAYFSDATAGTFTISGIVAGDTYVRAVALDSSNNEGNPSQSWKETAA